MFRQDFSCPALLEDPREPYPYGAVTRYGAPFQTLPVPNTHATGLVRFRSPLLAESRLMSFPPATEMFQFAGFASCSYVFRTGYPCGWVAPFGDPGINDCSHLPRAYRSVPRPSSPLSAKASTRCPSFALLAPHPTAKTIKCGNPLRSEDTSCGIHQAQLCCTEAIPLGHTTRFFTSVHQQAPRPTRKDGRGNSVFCRDALPLLPARHQALHRAFRRLLGKRLPARWNAVPSVVEVNGLEPSTSCLQSRRSPS